jgi:hypothetical protein
VRYPQGGGLTAEQQAFRELIRMEAADRFAASEDSAVIAKVLRVHVRSVQRWRSAWDAGGRRFHKSSTIQGSQDRKPEAAPSRDRDPVFDLGFALVL